jgi:hypothetical protein
MLTLTIPNLAVRAAMEPHWVRLRKGRVKLKPEIVHVLRVLLIQWEDEARRATDLSTSQKHRLGEANVTVNPTYWSNCRSHCKHLLSRVDHSLATRDIEGIYEALAHLNAEAQNVSLAATATLDGRSIPGDTPGSAGGDSEGVAGESGTDRPKRPRPKRPGRNGKTSIKGSGPGKADE